jgi:hypothetical protein
MLRSADSLRGSQRGAEDGLIGRLEDFLFDDRSWAVRYLVADTGHWLPGRRVLLSPSSLGRADYSSRRLQVALSRAQIENSPPIEEHLPVSRQREHVLAQYYGWPMYWAPEAVMLTPQMVPPGAEAASAAGEESHKSHKAVKQAPDDPHLRSVRDITGYRVSASDGKVGHIDDFVIRDEGWTIEFIVVDTRDWLPGRQVLVSPRSAREIDWDQATVRFDLTRDFIEAAPPYDSNAPINEETEIRFSDYYGRPTS